MERAPSSSGREPDIMNDPEFDINTAKKEKEDPDTCRICRGEGAATEPLFYPCKCSGSIRFVHQDCLMEWLSHSQKKYCELCKTPFRFTKLYHPQMPSTVPLAVFLKQAGVHALNTFLTWARWNLVIFVWLGWVPWCMRTVWRGLFWIGDGGWFTAKEMERQINQAHLDRLATRGTSPANIGFPFLGNGNAKDATVSTTGGLFSAIWLPWVKAFNLTSPVASQLAKASFLGFGSQQSSQSTDVRVVQAPKGQELFPRPPTLLSGFSFLRNLTRISTVNNLAIDVLEGQLITLAVVVVFILVFLIREWVVQQQPAINAAPPVLEPQVEEEPREREEERAVGGARDVDGDEANVPPRRILPLPAPRVRGPIVQRELGRARDRPLDMEINDSDDEEVQPNGSHHGPELGEPSSSDQSARQSGTSARPTIPDRKVFARIGEIQRAIEERAEGNQSWPGIEVFMELWRRSGQDPETVLRIIHDEGRQDELAWVVSAMHKVQARQELHHPHDMEEETSHISLLETGESSISDQSNGPPQLNLPARPPTPVPESHEVGSQALMNGDIPNAPTPLPQASTDGRLDAGWSFGNAPVPDQDQNHGEGSSSDDDTSTRSVDNQMEVDREAAVPVAEAETRASEAAPEVVDRVVPQTLGETLQEWLWGELPILGAEPEENDDEDDGQVVHDIAEEAPFVPVAQGQPVVGEANGPQDADHQDPEVLQAAAEAGIDPNDPEAMEDGDDLEGVMELIGMQGPIAGLIQNGMFSAVLISMSLISGIWVPYVVGKASLVLLANPVSLLVKIPLKWMSIIADLFVDVAILVAGWAFCLIDAVVRTFAKPIGWAVPFVRRILTSKAIPELAWKFTQDAAARLKHSASSTGLNISESDVPVFSIIAHESLVKIRHSFSRAADIALSGVENTSAFLSNDSSFFEKVGIVTSSVTKQVVSELQDLYSGVASVAYAAPSIIKSNALRISLELPKRTEPLDFSLAQWSAQDRFLTILFGYCFFFGAGMLYLKVRKALKDPEERDVKDGGFVDVLNQAGGVTKVILIISIEMIVFPLYCGMLLDIALLPLFDRATVASRLSFTIQSPATSIFVHWFVGTCYMFHFALFVSMCRKIMRSGVLYFIRDPDDPSFHPVRDVLERNVYAQLRKIAFSALVYGGLVIVCLGAVVWGIPLISGNVFPIQWSSNQPVLDFPVDLLAYNFLMPIAIKFFRPSKGLHAIYKWWFGRCARWLRLSHFLFNERKEDEEGCYMKGNEATSSPNLADRKDSDGQENRRLLRSGRFVRAPASDSVRLPKGASTFVDIDEDGNRLDGKPDREQGPHGRQNEMFSTIYVPPNFRCRIAAFIILLWLFAATTGVGVTVVPLVFGRAVFKYVFAAPTKMNDVYAFAIGTYLLGGPLYLAIRYRETLKRVLRQPRTWLAGSAESILLPAKPMALRALRLVYFYLSFSLLLPTLLAMVFEAYLLIPLHTYTSRHADPMPRHTVHFVQDWTLGVLALKLSARILLAHPTTRPAQALRALVSSGNRGASWANPDIKLASRAFIVPASIIMVLVLAFPACVARFAMAVLPWLAKDESRQALVYRYAYPATLLLIVLGLGLRLLTRAMMAWRAKVRDEVYLIGERLHNFGEKRPKSMSRVVVR